MPLFFCPQENRHRARVLPGGRDGYKTDVGQGPELRKPQVGVVRCGDALQTSSLSLDTMADGGRPTGGAMEVGRIMFEMKGLRRISFFEKRVTEKGLISFAARKTGEVDEADRREIAETAR